MKSFELPPELTPEQATQLRMAVVVANDNNWDDFVARGWEVCGSPSGRDAYCFEDMFPSITARANIEASRRASLERVYIPSPADPRQDCGRVALGNLSGVEAWQSWGFGTTTQPRLHTIGNAEIFGDEFFAERIPKAEAELKKVGRLLIHRSSSYGWNIDSRGVYTNLLETTGDFLGGSVEELDLVSAAQIIHDKIEARRRQAHDSLVVSHQRPEKTDGIIRRLFGHRPTSSTAS